MSGYVAVSWGAYGGFYARFSRTISRVCLGWVAITWHHEEYDDVLSAFADSDPGEDGTQRFSVRGGAK